MMDIVIDNRVWRCPGSWDEITLRKAMELEACVDGAGDAVKDSFAVQFEPSARGGNESGNGRIEGMAAFCRRVVSVLCGAPGEVCAGMDPGEAEALVRGPLAVFVVSMIFEPVYRPRGIGYFDWRGERLWLPRSRADVKGGRVECADVAAEAFCSATDLYVEGRIRYAAAIVALLCRPRGEEFDRERAAERAAGMEDLTMDVVLELFFCLRELIAT